MVTEDDLTLGGGHTIQYTDHVSQKSIVEIYVILLTNVTSINLNKIPFNKVNFNLRNLLAIPQYYVLKLYKH